MELLLKKVIKTLSQRCEELNQYIVEDWCRNKFLIQIGWFHGHTKNLEPCRSRKQIFEKALFQLRSK